MNDREVELNNKLASALRKIVELEEVEALARGLCISMQNVRADTILNHVQYSRLTHLYKVLFTITKGGAE